MAITGRDRGSGNNGTNATTFTLNPGSNFNKQQSMAVLLIAADNSASAGSAENFTSVTDTLSNTWTERQTGLFDNGNASAGVQIAIYTTLQNGGILTTGTTITVTFGANTAAKAWALVELEPGSDGQTIQFKTSAVNTGATTGTPTVTTSSITSGDVVVGLGGAESGDTWAGDADATNGSWSTHQHNANGTGATGMSVTAQYKVVTGTATQTYNPTLTSADVILGWMSAHEIGIRGYGQANATIKATTRGVSQAAGLITRAGATSVIDSFTRSASNSLGTADTGGTWTFLSGTASAANVNGTEATFVINSSTTYVSNLTDVLIPTSTSIKFRFKVSSFSGSVDIDLFQLASNLSSTVRSALGGDTGGAGYLTRIRYNNASTRLEVYVGVDGINNLTATLSSPSANTWYVVETTFVPTSDASTRARAKIYLDGGTPTSYVEDSSFNAGTSAYLQAPGHVGLRIENNATTQPTVSIDDIEIKAAAWTVSGQANAQIYRKEGQAQAQGVVTRNGNTKVIDSFTRSVTDGLGTADTGGAWTYISGPAANADVNGSAATFQMDASTRYQSNLSNVLISPANEGVSIRFRVQFSILPTADQDIIFIGGLLGSTETLSNSQGLHVRVYYKQSTDRLALFIENGTTGIDLSGSSGAYFQTPDINTNYWVEVLVSPTSGSTQRLRARVYQDGAIPGDSFTTTAALGVPLPGHAGLTIPTKASSPPIVTLDDLEIQKAGWTVSGQAQAKIRSNYFGQAQGIIGGPATSIVDTFTRSVTDGLGTADTGGAWTFVSGVAANADVNGTEATFVVSGASNYQGQLRRVLVGGGGASVSYRFKISALPTSDYPLQQISTNLGSGDLNNAIGVQAYLNFGIGSGFASMVFQVPTLGGGATSSNGQDKALSATTWYTVEYMYVLVPVQGEVHFRYRWYEEGTTPPAYTTGGLSGIAISALNAGHAGITIFSGTTTPTISFDSFNVTSITGWTESGQAQAQIILKRNGLGQANAYILNGHAHAQAHALINGTFTSAVDTFTRSVSDGLGTADTGGAWTFISGTAANADVNGSEATIQQSSSGSYRTNLRSVLLNSQSATSTRFRFKLDILPDNNENIFNIQTGLGSTDTLDSGYVINAFYTVSGTNVRFQLGANSGAGSDLAITTISAVTWYVVEVTQARTSGGKIRSRVKIYQDGNTPSDYSTEEFAVPVVVYPGHVGMQIPLKSSGNLPTLSFDDLEIKDAGWTESGQAQARIKQTYTDKSGQAQADIKQTYTDKTGQAQADIKQTYFGLGQAQAKIFTDVVTAGYGQAQADIKQTYTDKSGQVQADIKAIGRGFGQSQADIKQTYTLRVDYSSRVIADGATSYWRFGESSGNPQDSVGTNHVTVTSGTPSYGQPGLITQDPNTSIFSSDADYLIPDNNALDLGDNFSIELWFKPNVTGFLYLLNKDASYALYLDGTNRVYLYKPGIGDVAHSNGSLTNNGSSYHIVVTKNGSNIHIYRNSIDETVIDNTFTMVDGTDNLTLGSVNGSNKVNGTLDEIAFYKGIVLTPGQVATHYTIGTKSGTSAQAQAQVKNTYFGLGQAQADIKATSFGLGQAQADIKQTYIDKSGQANALIGRRVLYDTFTRTTSNGWGTSDDGATTWIHRIGPTSFSTDGSEGVAAQNSNNVTALGYPYLKNGIVQFDFNSGNRPSNDSITLAFTTLSETYNIVVFDTIIQIYNYFGDALNYSNSDANTWFTFKAYVSGVDGDPSYWKIWKVGDQEPDWLKQSEVDINSNINRTFTIDPLNTQDFLVDNIILIATNEWVEDRFGQAKANIKATRFILGQAQADIKQTYYGLGQAQASLATRVSATGQAQADIKAVGYGLGQAQSDIKQTYFGLGQSQADIKNTYNGCGQAQACIVGWAFAQCQARIKNTYYGHGQAQACIRGNAFGQTQADIKNTYYGLGQCQANIKQVYYGLGQCQADIKNTYFGSGQCQADIKAVGYGWGQCQADIKATNNGHGQCQADIKQTYYGSGQCQAWIKQTYFGSGQCQADIKNTYYGYAQCQADIKAQGYGSGQCQADIKQTYFGHGQCQADIKNTYYGSGQAQAKLNAFGVNGYGQAQAQMGALYFAWAQAQAKLNSFGYNQWGQCQADIKATSYVFGQCQADIKQTYNQHGQCQAWIKNTYYGLGQCQTDIKAVGYGWGQAQACIVGKAYGQTQADIKNTYFGHGQCQADIKAQGYGLGQCQADIKATNYGHGQANCTILGARQGYAQCQADIKATSYGSGQCQADIRTTYNQHGQCQGTIAARSYASAQCQAWIKATYYGHGQSQADIKAQGYGSGQSQGDIKQTYNSSGQAQGDIRATYYGSGQAQAYILIVGRGFGQAQGSIKNTYTQYGQAQARIKNTYYAHANAQSWIETTINNYGQAQGGIKNTYFGSAQTEAYILKERAGYANAQALIVVNDINAYAQSQALITKSAGYGQAQALIIVVFFFGTLDISDSETISLTLEDSIVDDITEEDVGQPQLILEDSTFGLTLEDSLIQLDLTDELYH